MLQQPLASPQPAQIERMFSGIVPWYDLLNRGLSLGRDIYWRRELVRGLSLPPGALVLDVAAGTLDVSLEVVRQFPDTRVLAADFSLPMLLRGQQKLRASRRRGIFPVAADANALPFPAASVDALTIAFGIRNLPDHRRALEEMHRVLRPGGTLAILEFVPPTRGCLARLYELYLTRLLPLVGRRLSRHAYAYSYLAASILSFPPAPAFARLLQESGFQQVRWHLLTLGIVGLFYGEKEGQENPQG